MAHICVVAARKTASNNIDLDDSALVEALQQKSPDAMAILFDRYAVHVQKVLVRVMGIDSAIPELLHDVFLRAFSQIHAIKNADKLKAWLTSIALFSAKSLIRKRVRRRAYWCDSFFEHTEPASLPVNYEIRETLRCMYQVLDRMPPDERIVFALRFIEGMELAELATVQHISLSTVKRRLSQAKETFAKQSTRYPSLEEWIEKSPRWNRN